MKCHASEGGLLKRGVASNQRESGIRYAVLRGMWVVSQMHENKTMTLGTIAWWLYMNKGQAQRRTRGRSPKDKNTPLEGIRD